LYDPRDYARSLDGFTNDLRDLLRRILTLIYLCNEKDV